MLKLSLREIIHEAIKQEEKSVAVYHFALEKVMEPNTQVLLEGLMQAELAQIESLKNLLTKELESPRLRGIDDPKILHFLSAKEITKIHSFQDALLLAIKKEQLAVECYSALSRLVEEPKAKRLFELLAEEELAHKRKVEDIYNKLVQQGH